MKTQSYALAHTIRDRLIDAVRLAHSARIERAGNMLNDLHTLQKLLGRMAKADQRGWRAAMQHLEDELQFQLRQVGYQLSELQHLAHSTRPEPPTVREILEELDALESEFGGYRYDRTRQTLSVTTDPITLEEVGLGPFEIQLDLAWLNSHQRGGFHVVAIEPNPPSNSPHVTHPHVSDKVLCAGDAAAPIENALQAGRLCDFFMIVRQVLQTYNAESAYVSLEDWDAMHCRDCDRSMGSDERNTCNRCDGEYCDECIVVCEACLEPHCRSCISSCGFCEQNHCESCLSSCRECDTTCCPSCLSDGLCPDCVDERAITESESNNTVPPSEGDHAHESSPDSDSPALDAPGSAGASSAPASSVTE